MNRYLILSILLVDMFSGFAQNDTVIKLSPAEIEAAFLKQNLQLIAEHLNVDLADAAIVQAGLWDNPDVSVGNVNLWTKGKEKQFTVEISQLIQTAGKRAKLVNREKTGKELALLEFESILLDIKMELRKTVHELVYLQSYQKALDRQKTSLNRLVEAFRKQLTNGNISKPELLRLHAALLELTGEINENTVVFQEHQKMLKSLLNAAPEITVEIDDTDSIETPEMLLPKLLQTALENRPDLRRQQMQVRYYEKSLAYEKSLKMPNFTVHANYDRYGGVWKDFAGVGIGFDLPFFNRNQGNIKAARIGINQHQYLLQHHENKVGHDVTEAFNNYSQACLFYREITENDLFGELDSMLELYAGKLLSKNIGMLEFIDFMNTYKQNKRMILSAEKQLKLSFEKLQYAVGGELRIEN